MKKIFLFSALLLCLSPLKAQNPDRRAVYNAALDYVEGMYEAAPDRIKRSVHPDLVKRGFYWKTRDSQYSEMTTMTFEQLVQISKDWNRSGWLPADAPKEIEIFAVQDKTAAAKVTAQWGSDYLQLVKYDNGWMIVNILWQAEPKKTTDSSN